MASAIAGTETNIDQVSLEERDVTHLASEVPAAGGTIASHLARIIRTIRGMPDVRRVYPNPGLTASARAEAYEQSRSSPRRSAPAAIGTYSQAVRAGDTLWVSGPDPASILGHQGNGAGRHRGAGAPGVRESSRPSS